MIGYGTKRTAISSQGKANRRHRRLDVWRGTSRRPVDRRYRRPLGGGAVSRRDYTEPDVGRLGVGDANASPTMSAFRPVSLRYSSIAIRIWSVSSNRTGLPVFLCRIITRSIA